MIKVTCSNYDGNSKSYTFKDHPDLTVRRACVIAVDRAGMWDYDVTEVLVDGQPAEFIQPYGPEWAKQLNQVL